MTYFRSKSRPNWLQIEVILTPKPLQNKNQNESKAVPLLYCNHTYCDHIKHSMEYYGSFRGQKEEGFTSTVGGSSFEIKYCDFKSIRNSCSLCLLVEMIGNPIQENFDKFHSDSDWS